MKQLLVCMLAACAALAGCVSVSPRVDAELGQSMTILRAQQTLNPNAPSEARPALPGDGTVAYEAIGRYHQSFRSPPPAPAYTIGVSGTTSH